MKKTCSNCKFYAQELLNPDFPAQHIHDWCFLWNRDIPCYVLSDDYDYSAPYWNDIDTGEAFCHAFRSAEQPAHEDEWFERNRLENIRNRMEEKP